MWKWDKSTIAVPQDKPPPKPINKEVDKWGVRDFSLTIVKGIEQDPDTRNYAASKFNFEVYDTPTLYNLPDKYFPVILLLFFKILL